MIEWLPRLVARTKASIHAKLLVAFLGIVALMLVSGAIGLNALSDVNHRTADMVQLQRKIAAYRQLNHDTISQLYSVASALLKPEDRRLDATLRQLNQFGYDLDRLQFVAQDEVELLGRVRGDYEEFIRIVTQSIKLIRAGRITEGRDLQLTQATPLADRLERLTNELVNRAEAEMVARVEDNAVAYAESTRMVAIFAVVSIVLALGLGYAFSVSVIHPVTAMEKRMTEIAAGNFTNPVQVANRDELGSLAAELNLMGERLGNLYRELERSVEQLRSLSEVGQAVNSTLDVQEVLSAIVTRAVGLSTADGGVVYEYDEASEEFHMRATYGYSAGLVETLRAKPLRFDDGATGRAATTRAPVQIPDLRIEGAYTGPLLSATRQEGVLAVLAVPLLREGRILGSLVVSRKSVGEFSDEIVDLLKTFAAQSTLAIQNARLFREIEQKSRELEAASHHKSEFLANMSHELRTPLNAVIGFSEVLQQKMFGDLNEKQVEYVEDIHSSGRHLLSLINDILDLSKIEAGKVELDCSRFDLPNTIDGTLTLVRERATRHGLTMDLSLDEELGEIEADERKVRQILLNLLSNAVKFTPDGGSVEVKGSVVDGAAQIAVRDTGIGIAPEDQATIFEEFQQVGGDHEGKREGTGLGLTLARRFVELHGGRIWVESVAGQGATFTFTLPLSPPKQATTPHSEPEEIKSEGTQQWAAN